MYDVTLINNYVYALTLDNGNQAFVPGTYHFTNWGSHFFEVPGMGPINFLDIASEKLPGYTNPQLPWTEMTWGGVVRYQGMEAYFRYEGQGKVTVTVDQFGTVSLNFGGQGMMIDLNDLTAQ